MKIKLDTQTFLDALDKARTALPKKTVIPITDYFLISIRGEKATVSATNMETTISITTACKGDGDADFCMPGKLLHATVKLLREPDFIINTKNLDKKSSVELVCGKAKYTFGCFPAVDFPVLSSEACPFSASFHSSTFKDTMQAVSKFVDEGGLRPALQYILVSEKDQKILFCGASGMSMGRHHNAPHSISQWKDVLISPTLSPIIEKCFSDKDVIDVSHNDKKIFIQNEDIVMSSVASVEKYPDIDGFFVNMKPETSIVLNTVQVRDSLERLKLFSSKETLTVNLQAKGGKMIMWASDEGNNNSGEEEITIGCEDEIYYAFNIDGLLGVISSFDNVEFEWRLYKDSEKMHNFIYPLKGDNERDNKEFILMPVKGVKRDNI